MLFCNSFNFLSGVKKLTQKWKKVRCQFLSRIDAAQWSLYCECFHFIWNIFLPLLAVSISKPKVSFKSKTKEKKCIPWYDLDAPNFQHDIANQTQYDMEKKRAEPKRRNIRINLLLMINGSLSTVCWRLHKIFMCQTFKRFFNTPLAIASL